MSDVAKIAHITPHLGGGVGEVIKALFSYSRNYENSLFSLDWCKSNFDKLEGAKYSQQGIYYTFQKLILEKLAEYDIILIHYWNHPLMADFLFRIRLPKSRLIFWCHNSGLHEPHIIPSYLSKLSNLILFTSECSMLIPNSPEILSNNEFLRVESIHSTRSLDSFFKISLSKKKKSNSKNLLYVGTVSKAKMHPESAYIFAELSKKGYSIDIVGGMGQNDLDHEVKRLGGIAKFHGPVSEVSIFYNNADAFIYPLRSDHYGTGEQVILEAMASGLPVIAFANPAEKAIIEDGVEGFLAVSAESFVNYIEKLFDNGLIYSMGKLATKKIHEKFSVEKMLEKLENCYKKTLEIKKDSVPNFSEINGDDSKLNLYRRNSFLEDYMQDTKLNSQNVVNEVYEKIRQNILNTNDPERWLSENKSTPFHYLKYFPFDKDLLLLAKMVQETLSSRII